MLKSNVKVYITIYADIVSRYGRSERMSLTGCARHKTRKGEAGTVSAEGADVPREHVAHVKEGS